MTRKLSSRLWAGSWARPSASTATARFAPGLLAATLVVASVPANAGEVATDEQIAAAMNGNSLQGSMLKDPYAEFYRPDGTIKGDGYTGKWRVANNEMCFQYGEKPEACWALEINGPSVILFKEGKVDGNGMILEGNPHNF